jgi:hypothetical protein
LAGRLLTSNQTRVFQAIDEPYGPRVRDSEHLAEHFDRGTDREVVQGRERRGSGVGLPRRGVDGVVNPVPHRETECPEEVLHLLLLAPVAAPRGQPIS